MGSRSKESLAIRWVDETSGSHFVLIRIAAVRQPPCWQRHSRPRPLYFFFSALSRSPSPFTLRHTDRPGYTRWRWNGRERENGTVSSRSSRQRQPRFPAPWKTGNRSLRAFREINEELTVLCVLFPRPFYFSCSIFLSIFHRIFHPVLFLVHTSLLLIPLPLHPATRFSRWVLLVHHFFEFRSITFSSLRVFFVNSFLFLSSRRIFSQATF